MSKAVQHSGQAILVEDEMERCRRIADVLDHDFSKRFRELTPDERASVLATIGRYRLRAQLLEATLVPYRGY